MAGSESPRILVVDDSPVQLRLMHQALERAGFLVDEATNGAEALLQISEQAYNLVISDCQMPLMDGYQLCRLVKDDPATRELPVVLLTGAQNRLARFWARTCGADLFLTKGHKPEQLVEAAGRLVRAAALPQKSPRRARQPQEHALDAIQRRLAAALENRLMETTLIAAVGELRGRVEAPADTTWAFLELLEDLVLPGALYILRPSPSGPSAQLLVSDNLGAAVRDSLISDLQGDAVVAGHRLRLETRVRPGGGRPPEHQQHHAFPLPVAGGGFEGRWGIVLDPTDYAAHLPLFMAAWKEFQQVFGSMVTLEYLADANRRLLKADQARADFVSTVVHEIRNPLSATSSALRLLDAQHRSGDHETSGELIAICQRNVERLLRISNVVLDLERLELGQFTCQSVSLDAVSLGRSTLEELQALAQQRRISLDFDATGGPVPRIKADPDRAAQCLVNLLSNALAHSGDGGVVHLTVRDAGDTVDLEVMDHGPGIPEDFQSRLFQKFQQAEHHGKGGTGLGLAITRKLMEAMGGDVTFRSAPGTPTTFTLHFPKAR